MFVNLCYFFAFVLQVGNAGEEKSALMEQIEELKANLTTTTGENANLRAAVEESYARIFVLENTVAALELVLDE